jgi:hypothetical protein
MDGLGYDGMAKKSRRGTQKALPANKGIRGSLIAVFSVEVNPQHFGCCFSASLCAFHKTDLFLVFCDAS